MTHTILRIAVTVALLAIPAAHAQLSATSQDLGGPQDLDGFVLRLNDRAGNDLALTRALIAHLQSDPAVVQQVPTALRGDGVASRSAATLLHALERLGSPAAQDALAEVFADRGQRHRDRLRAVVAAGGVAAPTADARAALWTTALQRFTPDDVDVSNTAYLALGAMGPALRESSPKSYPDHRGALLTSLATTADPVERATLLKAVGNLHDPAATTDVAVHLFDDSAPVRASAAMALGLVQGEEARAMLLDVLHSEPRGVVRSTIVGSLGRLPADVATATAVHAAVLIEPHPEARGAMVDYLVEHVDLAEGARDTLAHLQAEDPSQRVRLAAATLTDG